MHPTLRNALLALLITGGIFAAGFWTADTINNLRLSEIQDIEERIAIDILSLETQFDLMGQLACSEIAENSVLSSELNPLAEKLAYAEETLGVSNKEVVSLKRQYSLLAIKDYLLMKEVTKKCGLKPVFILYFYSNAGDCSRCDAVGNILTYLREKYAGLRVYSFDYHLDLGALKTLIAIMKIKAELPVLVIDEEPFYGLDNLDSIEKSLPLEKLSTSTPSGAER